MAVTAGYQQTEVGLIPEDWEVKVLGDLGEALIGLTYKPSDVSEYGTLVLRSSNIQNGALDFDDNVFVDTDVPERIRVRPGDVLVCVRNGSRNLIGKSVFLDERVEGMTFGAFMAVYRSSIGKLVSFLFQSPILKRQIDERLGATINQITNKSLNSFRIPFPSAEVEREAITTALGDVDHLLHGLDRLIAKKRAIKQAAMQQLLTGTSRLPGFSGEWKTRELGRYVTFLRHGSNSRAELMNSGSVRYLHYGDIHTSTSVYLDPQETSMPHLPAERARTLDRLQEGDLVMVDASEDIDGVGKSVEIVDAAGVELVSGLHTIAARFDKTVLADGFKAYLQFIPTFRDHLRRLAAGTKVFATQRAHIAGLALELPSVAEQTAIAAVLSDMSAEIVALERRREKTRAIKQGMMQQLLTGRVRLVEPGVEGESAA